MKRCLTDRATRRFTQASTFLDGVRIERRYRELLGDSDRPVLIDVGSSWGTPYRWRRAIGHGLVRGYAVDPVEDAPTAGAQQIRHALGAADGEHVFWQTAFAQCSSCLEPNRDNLARYPAGELFDIVRKGAVQLRRADSLWRTGGYPQPDFAKVDVQGFERQVLEGFGYLLDQLSALELETHFVEMYHGEALFPEIHRFLSDAGFYLRHLEPQGPFEGEVVEANTFWIRRDHGLRDTVTLWEELNRLPPRSSYTPSRFHGLMGR